MSKKEPILTDKILKIKNEFEKELEEIKKKLAENLLYEIKDIKIHKIRPVSKREILDLSDRSKINTEEDAINKRESRYRKISESIKSNFRRPLEKLDKRTLPALQESINIKDQNIEEKLNQRTKHWKDDYEQLKREIRDKEENRKALLNKRIEEVDENLRKFYDIADFLILLKWKVKPKENAHIDLDQDQKNRKEGDFIIIDSYSLYSLQHGVIFDSLITNLPMEIILQKEEMVQSKESNPEHVYDKEYTYEIWGWGWKWVTPTSGLIRIPYPIYVWMLLQTLKYKVVIKYVSNEYYADSSDPKQLLMTITFPHTWEQYYWPYLADPICTLGFDGDFWESGLKWDAWGIPYKVKYDSVPSEDYYQGLVVDFFDGVRNQNFLTASFGISAEGFGVSLGIKSSWSEKAVCNVDGSTGQELKINITPYMNIWGEYTGVFHSGGWLKVLLNSIASDFNNSHEVGKIRFHIPLELYFIHHWGVGVTRCFVTSFYSLIKHNSSEGKSDLLYYTRYAGIPAPSFSKMAVPDIINSNDTTQVCLTVSNMSREVNLENIGIEIDNIDPYLRPVDGDYTRPNVEAERTIPPQSSHQYCWTLQANLTDSPTVSVTPQFKVSYKLGLPVPVHFSDHQLSVDGPLITINL
ncbi:MAG: hypothetical protein ACFFBH_16300 [Promethearchaeota archaeon]